MTAQAVRLTNVDIDNALKNKHFDVIFQPIFQLDDGAMIRMEAFVRWAHPGLGVLPPGAFISFFESQGRMSELTRYVIERALEKYVDWRGKAGPGFSVNLALSDLNDETFPIWLKELLLRHDFPAGLVTLECPSLPATTKTEEAGKIFERLQKLNVRLAIEVRGRANDLLRSLQPFPFQEVKTGGSTILRFARTVRGGPGLGAISELLEIAKENDASIVAVGVEDHASLKALTSLGFSAAQGNFLANVGEINGFSANMVNTVRKALDLEPLAQEALLSSFEARNKVPAEKEDPAKADAPEQQASATQEAEEQTDDTAAKEQAALKEKARRVKEAAKKRALKKAAEAKAAALKAKAELEEQQQRLKEAQTKRDIQESARKLQNRLSRTYEDQDEDEQAPVAANTAAQKPGQSAAEPSEASTEKPAEKPAQESKSKQSTGKTTAKKPSSAGAAKKSTTKKPKKKTVSRKTTAKKAPARKSAKSVTEEVETTAAQKENNPDHAVSMNETIEISAHEDDPSTPPSSAGLLLGGSLATPLVRKETSFTGADETDDKNSLKSSAATPEEAASEEAVTEAGRPLEQTTPANNEDALVLDEVQDTNELSVELLEEEVCPPLEALTEETLKSEDEELDQFFANAEELPHDTETVGEDDARIDQELLETGLKDLVASAPLETKKPRRHFLQKKYRIRYTGFWPESWKARWELKRAEKDAFTLPES